MKVISADSHIQEPTELYERWIPEPLRKYGPQIEVREDGSRYRVMHGRRPRRLDIAEARETEDDQNREFRADPTGGRDVARRLEDQARDGIVAEVLYPNSGLALFNSPIPEYQLAVAHSYNDWLSDLFIAHRNRFVPVGMVPIIDIDRGVAEAERLAKLGYRAIKVPISFPDRPYNHPDYDRLWAVCAEAGLIVSFHAFTNTEDVYPHDWGEKEGTGGALNMMAMRMVDGMNPVSLLVSSGALMRFPDLKVVIVECGAGWLAWLLYVLDEQYEKKHMWIQPKLDLKPSEYFLRQGYVTFSDDPIALRNLPFTGSGVLLWGSDYPHDEGTYPHSQAVIERTFADLAPQEKHDIVYANAAQLYGFN